MSDAASRHPNDPHLPISIIIPCFNATSTLHATLESVRAQTLPDWEAVCVDDGSADDTAEALDAIAQQDLRVRLLRAPHAGLAAARNRGTDAARGERLLFLDADDVLDPNALEELLKASLDGGDNALVTGGYELLDASGGRTGTFRFPTGGSFSVDALLLGNRLPPMTLVPRHLLGQARFDAALHACEDWDLWLRLAAAGCRLRSVPAKLFGYRLRAHSLGHQPDRMYSSGARVIRRWLRHASEPALVTDALHRWAVACGALAAANGHFTPFTHYWESLAPVHLADDFDECVADRIEWAWQFVGGAAGATWRLAKAAWLTQVNRWIESGPLVARREAILSHLDAKLDRDNLDPIFRFLNLRPDVRHIVIYGLGQNGLVLLDRLRNDPRTGDYLLAVADDAVGVAHSQQLGLPRESPRDWKRWPSDSIALVTPTRSESMRQALITAGGREGEDFLVLSDPVDPRASRSALSDTVPC